MKAFLVEGQNKASQASRNKAIEKSDLKIDSHLVQKEESARGVTPLSLNDPIFGDEVLL